MVTKCRWNPAKAERNFDKHGVHFVEAEAVFDDPHMTCLEDPEHSDDEDRFLAVGYAGRQLLVVAYTIRDDEAWIISARGATRAERRRYMRGDQIRDERERTIDVSDIPEIDFSKAVEVPRNVDLYRGILRVSLDEDVAKHYWTDEAVNDALRTLIAEGRAPKPLDD